MEWISKSFDKETLSSILKHPETARKNAWWLFTSFFWHKLKEELFQMFYEDEDPELIPDYEEFDIENQTIPNEILETMLQSAAEDFVSAMNNGLAIKINDKPYRVPKSENVSVEVLTKEIFKFPDIEAPGDPNVAKIVKACIYEVQDNHFQEGQLSEIGEENKLSRVFFKKLVWLTEKTDDGWERLTDIEAACYVWALQMAKYEGKYVKDVAEAAAKALERINKDVGNFTLEEITDCWIRSYDSAMVSIDTQFSATKMLQWAKDNNQESVVSRISEKSADDYWYIQGLKSFF